MTYDEFFVDVKLRFDVRRHFLGRDTESRQLVRSLFSAGIFVAEAQILKVVHSLGLN